MRKSKNVVIQVREYDGTIIEIEVEKPFLDFYKKETGRSKISVKALSTFINNLIQIHSAVC